MFTQTYSDESNRCSLVNKIHLKGSNIPYRCMSAVLSFFFFWKGIRYFIFSVRAFKLDICKNMTRTWNLAWVIHCSLSGHFASTTCIFTNQENMLLLLGFAHYRYFYKTSKIRNFSVTGLVHSSCEELALNQLPQEKIKDSFNFRHIRN